MKKVLIIVAAALAATFSMTSCVETTESESVTALREAKVALLQAEADQARYKAMEDSITAAIKQQASAAELEALLARYQKELLQYQLEMQQKENELIGNANQHVQNLYANYTNAVTELNTLQENLFKAQLNLSKANADLLDAQTYVAEQTAIQNEAIAKAQAQIEIYNNYSGVDKGEVQKQYDALDQNTKTLLSDMVSKRTLSNQAYQDVKDYIADYYTLRNKNQGYNELETTVVLLKTIDTIRNEYSEFIKEARQTLSNKIFIVKENMTVELPADFDYTRTFTNQPNSIDYIVYSLDAEVREALIGVVEDDIDDYINTTLGEEGTATTAATGLYLDVQIAKTKLDNVNASPNATDDEKKTAQKEYDNALEALAEGEATLAEKEAGLETLNRLLKAYDDGYDAYVAELDAFAKGELVNAYFQSVIVYEEAYDKHQENENAKNALNKLINKPNIIDVQALIEEQEDIIAKAEEDIENLSLINNYIGENDDLLNAGDASKNEVLAQYIIDYITGQIAQIEEQIAVQEQIVADAKAALDAALTAGDETPAE